MKNLLYAVVPDFDFGSFTQIEPGFPNWQKSFVSGKASTLFQVTHWIHSTRKTLFLTKVKFLDAAEGPPGCVHGGASAGLMDEVMGIAVWHRNEHCVTEKLELRYVKLLPLHEEALVFTEIVSETPKTLDVHATIYGLDKIPRVSGHGIFHRLNEEQIAHFRFKLKS